MNAHQRRIARRKKAREELKAKANHQRYLNDLYEGEPTVIGPGPGEWLKRVKAEIAEKNAKKAKLEDV